MKKTILSIFLIILILTSIVFVLLKFVVVKRKYNDIVEKYCVEFNLNADFVYSIIKVESDFDLKAMSSSGARGLMQIMSSTASWLAEEFDESFDEKKLFDAETNIKYGCFYLRYLFDKFKDKRVVICAYNAGETVVKNWLDEGGKIIEEKISFEETKNYLKKVEFFEKLYKFVKI